MDYLLAFSFWRPLWTDSLLAKRRHSTKHLFVFGFLGKTASARYGGDPSCVAKQVAEPIRIREARTPEPQLA